MAYIFFYFLYIFLHFVIHLIIVMCIYNNSKNIAYKKEYNKIDNRAFEYILNIRVCCV